MPSKTRAAARENILQGIRNNDLKERVLSKESSEWIKAIRMALQEQRGARFEYVRGGRGPVNWEARKKIDTATTGVDPDGGDGVSTTTEMQQRSSDTALQEIMRNLGYRIGYDDYNRAYYDVGNGRQYDSGGFEKVLKSIMAAAANSAIPFVGPALKKWLGKYNLFGRDRGLLSPDSKDFIDPNRPGPDQTLADEFMGIFYDPTFAQIYTDTQSGTSGYGTNWVTNPGNNSVDNLLDPSQNPVTNPQDFYKDTQPDPTSTTGWNRSPQARDWIRGGNFNRAGGWRGRGGGGGSRTSAPPPIDSD